MKNYKSFCKSVGEEKVSKEVEKRYAERLMRVFKKEESITERQLKALGREIASLRLANNGDLQSYVKIARGEQEGMFVRRSFFISRLLKFLIFSFMIES